MKTSADIEISKLIEDLVSEGHSQDELAEALRKALRNLALKMDSLSKEDEFVQDDEFDNMPI
ncbi:MAG: hypothetical protein P8L68_02680 [Paracoccaceae bacterium]|nr:hypothetical protein [Paracoccaceae bacterium]MDG1737282.1 hypothetical protein [Paracoccaceae bacterium]MDG2257380.1 hypothetical protein [Paracoccaceae bacterium]